ncbi:MAG TPA: phosphoribosyltransferase family protein [Terriglobales bacterium]|nr:phosphoribosyltransferase family protein [Terriglobales bacterium]
MTANVMAAVTPNLKPVISAEQIQKRVREMGRQISADYRGKTVHVLAVLENGFMFMADLVRVLELTLVCEFVKPLYRDRIHGTNTSKEIFFSPEIEVRGHHVLLVEGLVHSGVTTDFLMNGLRSRGAASVRLATLLDRQAARRVALQPDYFGFLVDDKFLVGYGLGNPVLERNLPYLASGQA